MKHSLLLALLSVAACSAAQGAPPADDPTTTPTAGPDASTLPDGGASIDSGGLPTDGWKMGAPFATEAPPFAKATHALQPTALWGAGAKAPFPTNSVWMDLTLAAGIQRVNVLPYELKALPAGLEVSMPKRITTADHVVSVFAQDVTLQTTEALTGRALTAHDALSATMRWTSAGAGTMTAPIVRGMPYVTAKLDALTPKIGTVHAILTVNGAAPAGAITGDRFDLTTNDGLRWIVYASKPLTFNASGSQLVASAPFTGALRVANVPSADAVAVLDAHRSAIPVAGAIGATVSGDVAAVRFTWKKEGSGPLAMAAMLHQRDKLVGATKLTTTYGSLRGPMTLVEGDEWAMREPLSPITWDAPKAIPADKLPAIKQALAADAAVLPVAGDPYFYGKQVARLGRLALIADQVGDAATATSVRNSMKASLEPWLTGTNPDALKYDATWGGLCSTRGLSGASEDFGNGWYNDHHFHYGYFLYAAAALAKGDPAWLTAHKSAVYGIAREFANPSSADTAFTTFRNKDWFGGHSSAAGIFEFADGRNQESSSEAVNAYYGLQLLGLAAKDENLTNVGRVLLATEIASVQAYWQIKTGNQVYEAPFAARKVVGIVWGTKVDHATFFGANLEFIHGIQLIPFTPISETLLAKDWVAEEYPVLAPAAATAEVGWRGFIAMDHAIVAPEAAWTEIQALASFDDGNSRANALYWAATRP